MTTDPDPDARAAFVARFGGVYEHSPWIMERAYDASGGAIAQAPSAADLSKACAKQFAAASREERLAVLRAHPDLAGKLAAAKRLTASSSAEQSGAGLDALTDAERARFEALNTAYTERFGHPFIMAVAGRSKTDILSAFERRAQNDADTEFTAACAEVDTIARLRLEALLS